MLLPDSLPAMQFSTDHELCFPRRQISCWCLVHVRPVQQLRRCPLQGMMSREACTGAAGIF